VNDPRVLPSHVEETFQTTEKMHSEHQNNATGPQRAINRITAVIGQPRSLLVLMVFFIAWTAGNLIAEQMGFRPWDAPPFFWLQGATGVAALYMTVLILATQRHAAEFSGHREQLTLQLALLSEQKSAKIIQLLGELRRDNPMMRDRDDREATAMSTPADSGAVLDAIKEAQDVTPRGVAEPPLGI
jgi:uncharacterized membrane protein